MNFDGVRVLVVGDVMLDHYITCRVNRISPEAPVPIALAEDRWAVPGGAANVARNLARLGAESLLVGLVGQDEAAQNLQDLLEKEKISNFFIFSEMRSTICKTRILAQGQQLLRIDEEKIALPASWEYEQLCEKILHCLPGCGAVILSDYGKGALMSGFDGRNICSFVIDAARALGLPTLVDPKGTDWGRYAGAQCITPNAAEYAAVCGQSFEEDIEGRERQAAALREQFAFERLLVTRGSKGMVFFENGCEPCYIRDTAREVADVSGAGDTVIAVLGACVAAGANWRKSAHIANIAAGIAVGKMGTTPVDIDELNLALQESSFNPKLFTLPLLLGKIEEWRHKGERIVFTNGCFDLLHPGHISLVRQCVALGDRVVVALNSDVSVRRLKGASRPVQDEQSRALLIAALRGVDAVILFDEDTPLMLIEAFKPDVLVKGADYTEQTVVGADFVKGYGGLIHLATLAEGCSTTKLIRRMGGD